jgi:hypothetical protein
LRLPPAGFSVKTQVCKGQLGNAERGFGRLPSHSVFSHEVNVVGKDFAPAEGAHERLTKTPYVIPLDITAAVMSARRYSPNSMSVGGQ